MPSTDVPPRKAHALSMWQWWLVGALVAAAAIVGASQIGETRMLEPDSPSYIDFAGIRGLAYPLFLYVLRSLGLSLEAVLWVQLTLNLATIPVLFAALYRAVGNSWIPTLIVLLAFVNPEVAKYHAKIMSESLFLTVLTLYIAAFLSFLDRPSRKTLACAALLAAAAVTVKSVGWAFVVLLCLAAVASIVRRPGRAAMSAAFLIPIALVLAVEGVASRIVHGPDRASLAPRHVFAKAGMIEADIPADRLAAGPNAGLHRALEEDAATIRRLIARAPTPEIARFLTVNYEVFLQYEFALAERRQIAQRGGLDTLLMDSGRERIRHGWAGYADLAFRHYLSLWMLYGTSHPALYEQTAAFLEAERPLPFEDSIVAFREPIEPAGVKAVIARPVIALSGVVTFVMAGLGLLWIFRPGGLSPLWASAGLLALGLHGYCLLVALAGVGIPRYLLGVWPLLACALGLGGAALLSWVTQVIVRDRPSR